MAQKVSVLQESNRSNEMRKSTISIERMIELYHELNGNHYSIAKVIGCSREYVRQKLSPLGLAATRATHPEIVEQASKDAEAVAKFTGKVAREALGITSAKFKTLRKRTGTSFEHGNRKVTNEQLIKAYQECRGHYTKMGQMLGVRANHVSRMMKARGLSENYPSKGRQL
jgi:transcriptional regulator of acetoin/glycerol metabolism